MSVTMKTALGTELAAQSTASIDFVATLTKILELKTVEDKSRQFENELQRFIDEQDGKGLARTVEDLLEAFARTERIEVFNTLLSIYKNILKDQVNLMRQGVLLGAAGFPGLAQFMSYKAKLLTSFGALSRLHDIFYTIPIDEYMKEIEAWWKMNLQVHDPNLSDALKLLRWGYITRDEWIRLKLRSEGITRSMAERILDTTWNVLSERDAFRLYKRGIISLDEFRRILKRQGWKDEDHERIFKSLEYIPSFYDLLRLADYVPLDSLYITEVLRANGVRESDIPRLTTLIQLRPLREERRSVVGRLMYEYSRGYITKEYFLDQLKELRFLPQERTLYEYWADRQKEDYLMELKLDIVEQKVRKGAYADRESIVRDLKALGLQEEVANLLAEKWYWQYMVR